MLGRATRAPNVAAVNPTLAPRGQEIVLLAALFLSQVYYFYRYPFKYSDPGTSPTYGPTPQVWQIGKYVLFIGLAIVCLALLRRRGQPRGRRGMGFARLVMALGYGMVCLSLVAIATAPKSFTNLGKAWFFLPLVVLMPSIWTGRPSLERFFRVTFAVLAYNAVFEGVELFLYYKSGRLPALAYPGGSLVRFGAGLDDPNGFGIWLILPMTLLIAGWPIGMRRFSRLLLIALVGYLLLKTLSYSAFIGTFVGIGVVVALARETRKIVTAVVAVVGIAIWLLNSGTATKIFHFKQQSASTRFSLATALQPGQESVAQFFGHISAPLWLIGSPRLAPGTETTYVALVSNFGLIIFIGVMFAVITTVIRGVVMTREFRAVNDRYGALTTAALTGTVVGMSVSALGVPLLTSVFPTNLTFWMVAMAIWVSPRTARPNAVPRRRPMSGYADSSPDV